MVFNDSPQWSGRGIPMAELLSCPVDELRKKINRFDDHTILEILLMHIQIKILVSNPPGLVLSLKWYLGLTRTLGHVSPVAGIRVLGLHAQGLLVRARCWWC